MAEVRVTKEPKTERMETFPWFGLEAPLMRGGFFGVNPFTLMKHFTEEGDRMFGYKTAIAPPDAWRPAIEVKEEKGNLLVTAELPGVKKEDVRVTFVATLWWWKGSVNTRRKRREKGTSTRSAAMDGSTVLFRCPN